MLRMLLSWNPQRSALLRPRSLLVKGAGHTAALALFARLPVGNVLTSDGRSLATWLH